MSPYNFYTFIGGFSAVGGPTTKEKLLKIEDTGINGLSGN